MFEKFISSYYDSVGANFIPITFYSKFIALLFEKKKGNNMLIRLFVRFIDKRQRELFSCLRFLNYGETQFYRNYLRELNWE